MKRLTGAQGTKELPSIWMLWCGWGFHLATHSSCYRLRTMFLLQPRCGCCGLHDQCLGPPLPPPTPTRAGTTESYFLCLQLPVPLTGQLPPGTAGVGEPWEMQGSPSLRYICFQNAIQRIHGTATGKLAFPSTKPTQCPCTQAPLPRLLALSRSREPLTCHRGCKYEETRAENGVGVILAWRLGAHHAFFIHREIFDLPLTRTHG